ncbi:transglycosylase SLT domain-containing protein [bacterium]|nr:transglycosylase SLT domain-containing protein [bacterium]
MKAKSLNWFTMIINTLKHILIIVLLIVLAFEFLSISCQQQRRIIVQPVSYFEEEEPKDEPFFTYEKGEIQELIIRGKYNEALSQLNRKAELDVISLWQIAYCDYKLRKYDAALNTLDKIDLEQSILGSYRDYLKALVLFEKKEHADCISFIEPINRFNPTIREELYEFLYECLLEENKYDRAVTVLKEYRSKYPDSMSYCKYKYNLAYIDLLRGNKTEAFSSFLSLMKNYPTSFWGYKAGVELRNNKSKLTSTETYYSGLTSFEQKKWLTSIEFFSEYLDNPSNQTYRYKAKLNRAEAYYEIGKFSRAISEFKEMVKDKSFDEGLYRIGRCYHKLGDRKNASEYYNKLISDFPSSKLSGWALWWQVELHRENEEWDKVVTLCDRLFSKFPRHDLADNAILWAGIGCYMNEDYSGAIERFQKILSNKRLFKSEKFRATAACWLAISKYQLGNQSALDDFRKLSEEGDKSYYHFVGTKYLEKSLPDPVLDTVWTLNTDYTHALSRAKTALDELGYQPKLLSFNFEGFQRARILTQIGILDWAEKELNVSEKQFGSDPQTILELSAYYFELGHTYKSFDEAAKLQSFFSGLNKDIPSSIKRLNYPLHFYDDVYEQAKLRKIDPLLILALIRRESAFSPNAVSYANAIGLMQIIPSTGKTIANSIGEGYSDARLYDFKSNIKYGTWYLRYLLDKYDNRIEYALAAYNAGENQLQRWLKISHSRDNIEIFIENIDFQQTRHYIRNVMEDYYNYVRFWRQEN